MDPSDRAPDDLQIGVRSLNAKSGRSGSMTASFTDYPSKRDRQQLHFTNSPAKRAKLSSLPEGANSILYRKTNQSPVTGPFHNAQLSDANKEPSRKSYVKDSDNGNNPSGLMRSAAGIDAVTEATAEKLVLSDRREGLANPGGLSVVRRDIRLSQTPPFSAEFEGTNESPLPPTIKQRYASPGTIKRGLEEIYSSGKRKVPRERDFEGFTPEWSPTRKPRPSTSRDTKDHYYPVVSTGAKDKGYRMFIEHREALQREIRLLEDELVVERRKDLVGRDPEVTASTPNQISGFITQCLDINEEEVTRDVFTIQSAEGLGAELPPKLLRGKISLQHGTKDLSALTFTEYNTTARASDTSSLNHRFLQGYSHENLLHFKATMEVLPTACPIINSLKIDCSDWARVELGKSLLKHSMERNISVALYSISAYATLAKKRAECWVLLQNRFSRFTSIPNQPELNLKPSISLDVGSKIARRSLVANLQRRKMIFRGRNSLSNTDISSEVEVCLSWHIDVGDTGESHSDFSANIKLMPGANVKSLQGACE
ncbi:hypothetical protein TWF718_002734 [Orbilia javanica]|uniref:Uncharacterized protein n=1 Tax=Orbilia javanica TaxID=47235 RepID=A0AAN8MSK4_9PEZI